MDKLFKGLKELNETDYGLLWEKALIVFDTNVILDLYRLPESARKDLLIILSDKKISKRIWLPFQVVLEFTHNKLEAISDQKNKFNSVRKIIVDGREEMKALLDTILEKLNDLQLKKRHSVINPDSYINENLFNEPINLINNFEKILNDLDKKQPDVNDTDKLKELIYKTFEGKTGLGFTKDQLDEIFKEGELRYKDKIPPGFKDKDKEGFYLYEDKKILRKYGDLVLWKELIRKANVDKLEYLIFVTGDTKEDWWQEKRGMKLGPRYELINEIYFEVNSLKIFYMYDTSGFMQYSKHYLNIKIKEQSIKETKDLIESNKLNDQVIELEENSLSLFQLLQQVSLIVPIVIRFDSNHHSLPFVKIPHQVLNSIFIELFTFAIKYSSHGIIVVRYVELTNHGLLKMKFTTGLYTEENPAHDIDTELESIKSKLSEKYGRVVVDKYGDRFQIKFYIRKSYLVKAKNSISLF